MGSFSLERDIIPLVHPIAAPVSASLRLYRVLLHNRYLHSRVFCHEQICIDHGRLAGCTLLGDHSAFLIQQNQTAQLVPLRFYAA